jgi:ankyrin repeat protein
MLGAGPAFSRTAEEESIWDLMTGNLIEDLDKFERLYKRNYSGYRSTHAAKMDILNSAIESYDWDKIIFIVEFERLTKFESFTSMPLCTAILNESWDIAMYLLEKGADASIECVTGTPLSHACINNQVELVKLLIQKGADVNKPSMMSLPILDAISHRNIEIVDMLIQGGADLNPRIPVTYGYSTLSTCAMSSTRDIYNLLQKWGAEDFPDNEGKTAIHHAAMNGNMGILSLLVGDQGQDVNTPTPNRRTPLHFAAEHSRVEAVKYLLSHGADMTLRDHNGRLPEDLIPKTIKVPMVIDVMNMDPNQPLTREEANPAIQTLKTMFQEKRKEIRSGATIALMGSKIMKSAPGMHTRARSMLHPGFDIKDAKEIASYLAGGSRTKTKRNLNHRQRRQTQTNRPKRRTLVRANKR